MRKNTQKTVMLNSFQHPHLNQPLLKAEEILNQVQDDNRRRGFTLIELLVVVLIIGILAAVALPQYKLAVVKSRVSSMLPILASIVEAEEIYYLANGKATYELSELDISEPIECTRETNTTHYKCGKYFFLDFSGQGIALMNYCPGNANFSGCLNNRDFQIRYYFIHPSSISDSAKKECVALNGSTLGEKICKNMFPTQE